MHNQQLWVEPVGDLIIARIRGVPSEELLRECQEKVLLLLQGSQQRKVLYDGLEMEPPSIETVISQQRLDAGLGSLQFRRAIVVSNTRVAYLARLAFGAGDYRVFYSNMTEAINWLNQEPE